MLHMDALQSWAMLILILGSTAMMLWALLSPDDRGADSQPESRPKAVEKREPNHDEPHEVLYDHALHGI